MIALKRGAKVRPLTLGIPDRNLPGKYLLNSKECRDLCQDYLGRIQKGVNISNGGESIIHSFSYATEKYPHRNILKTDFQNAFNQVDRVTMLHEIKSKAPFLYSYCQSMYAAESTLSLYTDITDAGDVYSIKSSAGSQQGCVHGSLYFAMAVHPFLTRLDEMLSLKGDGEFIQAFIDDWISSVDDNSLLEVLTILLNDGPSIGLHLNRNKTEILIGLKSDSGEAISLRNRLIDPNGDFRLQSANVILHPDNDPSAGLENYGLVILGAPVGSMQYKHKFLDEKLQALDGEGRLLQAIDDPQCQMLLLQYCFSRKFTYLMRTIEPAIMRVHLPRFNSLIDDILGSIVNLNQSLMQPANLQCRLRIDQGGLGVGLLDITPSAAYGASFIACFPSLFAMDPTILTSLRSDCDFNIIQAFRSAISTINFFFFFFFFFRQTDKFNTNLIAQKHSTLKAID